MADFKRFKTMDVSLDEVEPENAEMVYKDKEDLRRLVKDTNYFPYNVIAFIETEFLSDDDSFAGTGFLADQYLFITCAHNVRDKDRRAARTVKILFGLNGPDDYDTKKKLCFHGQDFHVPKKYKSGTDKNDFAFLNLRDYYEEKTKNGLTLDWKLSDLPTNTFQTCRIPDEHGPLKSIFTICGYPGMPKVEAEGYPGFPPGTQWYVEGVAPTRIKDGRHLLYLDATNKGNSGSPIFHHDEQSGKAYVIGVHVGFSKMVANMAVPICYHTETSENFMTQRFLDHVAVKAIDEADSSATLGAKHKAELRQLLEQANLITYLDSFLNTGADDVKQLREADEDELQDILSDVDMKKPYHIKRFKKALENWNQGKKRPVSSKTAQTRSHGSTKPTSPLSQVKHSPKNTSNIDTSQTNLDPVDASHQPSVCKLAQMFSNQSIEHPSSPSSTLSSSSRPTKSGLIPKPILSSPRPSSSASAFQQSPHHPSSFSSAANYGLSSTSTTTSKNTTQSTTSPSMPSIGSKATTSTPKSSAEDLLKKDKKGRTGLMTAVVRKNIDQVQSILDQAKQLDVLIDLIDKTDVDEGRSPLWQASGRGVNNICQLLLENKADVNKGNKNGASPLFVASQNGHTEVVQTLLENKAYIDQPDNNGATPLYIASQNGHSTVAQLLIDNGASIHKRKNNGFTPIMMASQNGHNTVLETLLKNVQQQKRREVVNDRSNKDNDSPLTVAIQFDGQLETVKTLLKYNADPNLKGDGKSPLEWAQEKDKQDIVAYLRSIINKS